MNTTIRPTRAVKPATVRKAASTSSILGQLARKPLRPPRPEPTVCFACLKPLTAARVGALRGLNTGHDSWACVKCSDLVTTPRLGIYTGEVGTSQLLIVDKVYNDSVRDVFMELDREDEDGNNEG